MEQQRVVAMVGYGPGIGNALAERFGSAGFALGLIGRSAARVDAAARAFAGRGWRSVAAPADAGDAAALSRALEGLVDSLGAITCLLYNAAHWRPGPVLATTPEALAADLQVDVGGALAAARAVAPGMIARGGGSILFTGGGYALHPTPAAPTLSIGKAALRALALMLAEELAPQGVRVATVTIAGAVRPDSALSPARIAATFWALHESPADASAPEVVLR